METSTLDLDHYPFQHAAILHDPTGRLADLFRRLAVPPLPVRDTRLRVHYLETVFALGRAVKCLERGKDLAVRLVLGEGGVALVKLLAVARGSWAPTRHWAAEELRILGVPEDLLARAEAVFAAPSQDGFKTLREESHAFLDKLGGSFHHDRMALIRWAFLTQGGEAGIPCLGHSVGL